MPRIHFFEIEDQSWCPDIVRDFATDYLRHVTTTFDGYASVVGKISDILDVMPSPNIVDLGSGSGGGWPKLVEHLLKRHPDLTVTFTDFFPNTNGLATLQKARPDTFQIRTTRVDAREVPTDLVGLRTQFLSLHHFKPEDARRILSNAVDAKQPIAVFELTERNLRNLVSTFFSPILVWILTPFIRPFSIWRLLLTYVLPVVPFVVAFDGMVSTLRTYDDQELSALISSIPNSDTFRWEIGKTDALLPVVYLTGVPLAS